MPNRQGSPNKRKKLEHGKEATTQQQCGLAAPLACLLLPHETIQNMPSSHSTGALTTPQLLDAVCRALQKDSAANVRPVSHATPQLRYSLSRCPKEEFGFVGRNTHRMPLPHMTAPFVLHNEVYDVQHSVVVPQYRLHVAATRNSFQLFPSGDGDESLASFSSDDDEESADGTDDEEQEEDELEASEEVDCEEEDDGWSGEEDEEEGSSDLDGYDDRDQNESVEELHSHQEVPAEEFEVVKKYLTLFGAAGGANVVAEVMHTFCIEEGDDDYDEPDTVVPVVATYIVSSASRSSFTLHHQQEEEEEDNSCGDDDEAPWTLELNIDGINVGPLSGFLKRRVALPLNPRTSLGIRFWPHNVVLNKMEVPAALKKYWSGAEEFPADECPPMLPTSMFEEAQLTSLTLSNFWRNLRRIEHDFCRNTTKLQNLNLCACWNVFCIYELATGATSLTHVDLRGMVNLKTLDGAFNGSRQLKTVRLPHQHLETIHAENFPVHAVSNLHRLQKLTGFGSCNDVTAQENAEVSFGAFPELKQVYPSFCHVRNLVKLDLSACTATIESFVSFGCDCPSLENVIFGHLPKLKDIDCLEKDLNRVGEKWDNGFLTNCPSLSHFHFEGGSPRSLKVLSGRAFRGTPKLDFDFLRFVTKQDDEQEPNTTTCSTSHSNNQKNPPPRVKISSLDCLSEDTQVMTPFLDGSRLAKTVNWMELIRVTSTMSVPYLLFSYISHEKKLAAENGSLLEKKSGEVNVKKFVRDALLQVLDVFTARCATEWKRAEEIGLIGTTKELAELRPSEKISITFDICVMMIVLNAFTAEFSMDPQHVDRIFQCFQKSHALMVRVCLSIPEEALSSAYAWVAFAIPDLDNDMRDLFHLSFVDLLQRCKEVVSNVNDSSYQNGLEFAELLCYSGCSKNIKNERGAPLKAKLFPHSNSVDDAATQLQLDLLDNRALEVLHDVSREIEDFTDRFEDVRHLMRLLREFSL